MAGIPVDKEANHDWVKMVSSVVKHIRTLNWGYKTELIKLQVKYYNMLAQFVDSHTLKLDNGNGSTETVTADKIIIAAGSRPTYPGTPGDKEYAITSDDMFYLPKPPGKTCVIGASYVALECAGFLTSMGYDTTVLVRSILLRGFDEQSAVRIGDHMEKIGTKFIYNTTV